jgi:hypothetical protein
MDILLNTTLSQINTKYKLFNISIYDNFVIVSTNNINPTVSICIDHLNEIYNKVKYFVYEKHNNIYKLLFVVPRIIKNTHNYVKNIINTQNNLKIMCKYSGSYIVLFFSVDRWYFSFKYQVYLLDNNIHPILYNCVKNILPNLDTNICYHLILNDTRLRKILLAQTGINDELILLKKTYKYSKKIDELCNNFINVSYYYVSCLDELYYKLIELDNKNKILKKLCYLGFVLEQNETYISFNTSLVDALSNFIPYKYTPSLTHLYLYQNNKLNIFLNMLNSFVTNDDLINRINNAFNTLSKEILDIYHLTRNKKNSNLYNSLPSSYKKIIYILHKTYISLSSSNIHFDSDLDNEKMSLNISIVYKKLKEIDIDLLRLLFIERSKIMYYDIKKCSDTSIQCYLLK